MKKNIVLFILFILPIVAYLFFASGINSFGKLPIITKTIPDLKTFKTPDSQIVSFDNKISIVSFLGTEMMTNQGRYFNFTEQIFEKYKDFTDFQFVLIAPTGTEQTVKGLLKKISKLTTKTAIWHVVYGEPQTITNYYDQLQLKGKLDTDLGTKFVYIIDKKRNLRGRNDAKDYKEGYDTTSPADLHNEMNDDVKIILAEYRFALKRNNNKLKTLDLTKK
jgi:hypothetical protein